jgi:hypothetical protein
MDCYPYSVRAVLVLIKAGPIINRRACLLYVHTIKRMRDIGMEKTAKVMQLMMELNEERVGVQDALKAWDQWLQDEGRDYDYDIEVDEILEYDDDGEGRALLERAMCLANAFQAKLCDLLGVTHQPITDPDSLGTLIIRDPIGGGDDGVSTKIQYARNYSSTDNLVYVLTVSKPLPGEGQYVWSKKRYVVDYAHDTEQLVTLIGRGYMALRLMEGGGYR